MNNSGIDRPKVVASIEARMGSSRLPGKVLEDINGKPALTRLLNRLRYCRSVDEVILATSTHSRDDALERWAEQENIFCFRGSEDDVLQRVVDAHTFVKSDVIVEITGDSILTDPDVVDMGVEMFLVNNCDVVTNCGTQLSYPMGVYVQVFYLAALREVANTVSDPAVREHVSLYFYEHPERYSILNMMAPPRWHAPDYRFQLDYPEDLQFIREIYSRLSSQYDDRFGVEEIMSLLKLEPELTSINSHCLEKDAR
jgi:spore coat polysaccharide biosynthesis protein SpsF